ncbi:MAG: phosphoserine phosphatase SerB [Alphaproteobacteria bacterium]|nr:phosphoserine phosphatase SerB [Alphaproteobacteria bacterium]
MMDYQITLFASSTPLSAGHLAMLERFLEECGILVTAPPEWLEPHKAAFLLVAETLTITQMKALRRHLKEGRIDVFCTPVRDKSYGLFMADMDSTIVTSETLDELAAEAGIKDKIAEITARAMRGELDFHAALKERVGLLTGLDEDALTRTFETTEISKGAAELLKALKKSGTRCVLVSGGFTYFTSKIAGQLGFDAHHGNILDIENGQLTGTVSAPILDKDSKLAFLRQYVQELGIDMGDSIALGDGANDLPMLSKAGLGIGYRPKPLLADNLLNCLFYADLSVLWYLL